MSPGGDVRARDERGGGDQRNSDATFVFAVRVRPGASRTEVGGRYDGRFGAAVVVAVNAPAVDGRATEAALRATAAALGLRRSDVSLKAGATSRDKLLAVAGPPPDLADRLRTIRDGAGGDRTNETDETDETDERSDEGDEGAERGGRSQSRRSQARVGAPHPGRRSPRERGERRGAQ